MIDTAPEDIDLNHNPVSQPTSEALKRFAPLYAEEYRGYKHDFLIWLHRRGKKPFKGEGYAQETIKTTHYKIEKAYRWKWREVGQFTKEFTPEDAEQLTDHYVSGTTLSDREVKDHIKAFKRLFKWSNWKGETDYDWDYSRSDELEQVKPEKRYDHFKRTEMSSLYNAAIEYGSMKSYHSVTPEERDRLKAVLAQRLTKPKAELGPEDFKAANSWKFPALIATTIDLGLRPIEIKRSNIKWLRLEDQRVFIPRDESSKSDEPWECKLSSRTTRALRHWAEERESHEKYDDTDALWLTKYGNPYESKSLNDLLNRLMDKTEIKPRHRDLTWYAIRRGSATMWADSVDLNEARVQLRHKDLDTTKSYVSSTTRSREKVADDNW